MSAALLSELAHVKAYFQLRAICTVMGLPAPDFHVHPANDTDARERERIGGNRGRADAQHGNTLISGAA